MASPSETYVDIIAHILISLVVGYLLWQKFDGKSKKTRLMCLVLSITGGLLIDIDHLFDYFLTYGFVFNYNDFITGMNFKVSNKMYIPFHGFEYCAIFGLITLFVKKKKTRMYLTVFTVSMFLHLLTDIVLARLPGREYFIIYRILTGFNG